MKIFFKKNLINYSISTKPKNIFKIFLNRINHYIARKNIIKYPQLAIFSFDHIGLSINLEGRYENSLLNLLEFFINEEIPYASNHIALDIGANIGNHSIFLSKFFKNVHSFEPNPMAFDILSVNAKHVAQKDNIVPHKIGLSDASGMFPLIINPSNIGGSKIDLNSNKIKKNIVSVELKKADSLEFLKDEKISLMKIDVEGHEMNVLKGAESIIKINKPIIIFEQAKNEIINGKSNSIDLLSSLNYSFLTVQERFYLGESILGKLLSILLCSIFGTKLHLIKTSIFKKKFYDIVIAIPNLDS